MGKSKKAEMRGGDAFINFTAGVTKSVLDALSEVVEGLGANGRITLADAIRQNDIEEMRTIIERELTK